MPLTFTQALQSAGVDPGTVRLLRHQTSNTRRTPYSLWRDDRSSFEAYQAVQEAKNRSRLAAPIWASFVVSPDGDTLFAGLYGVRNVVPVPHDWSYPITERPARFDQDELYQLVHLELLADLEGRLFVDWGAGTRTWVQRADQQDKPITQLTRRFAEPPFPGFSAFCEPLSRITALPATWTASLSAARGVYLLTCPITKELYVGSATGEGGFYQRWCSYAINGHGGNIRLRSRDPSDYQISILEVAGSLARDSDVLDLEMLWKSKLQSREMGLNAN